MLLNTCSQKLIYGVHRVKAVAATANKPRKCHFNQSIERIFIVPPTNSGRRHLTIKTIKTKG